MKELKKPYFGAAYYPEAWPASLMDEDIGYMRQLGMNVMRMAEFAWSTMEPREGEYDFSLFDAALDKLEAAGIAAIMCTPTCTPPAWLAEKYPEIFVVGTHGERATHGARRNACPNNEKYRELCEKIIARMGERFGRRESVIGWQIDNELYNNTPDGRGCCCPVCVGKFRAAMEKKYGDIDNLNAAWGTDIWSQRYDSFDQLPVPPRSDIWHHPSLLSAWMRFQADSYADFCGFQAELLHKYTSAPVGTDMMPFFGLDYEDMTKPLDVVQCTEYRNSTCMSDLPMWFSYYKNLKNKPFWTVETAASWGGGTARSWLNEENFCIANSWLPLICGSDSIMYWLWRNHYSGQELMHGSVITSWGRPSHVWGELCELRRGFDAAADMIAGTAPVKGKIALHISSDAARTFAFQPITYGFNYENKIVELYVSLREKNYNPEVIDPSAPLDDYKIVLSPFLPCIEHKGLSERIFKWIEGGGIWIAGPFTDIRTASDTYYKEAPFGFIEKAADLRCDFSLPAGKPFEAVFDNGNSVKGDIVFDAFTPGGRAKTVARYTQSYLAGHAAITETPIGDKGGKLVLLGTYPTDGAYPSLVGAYASAEGIAPCGISDANVVLVERAGEAGRFMCAVEIKNQTGTLVCPCDGTDIFTGKRHKKGEQITLKPHGVLIISC